MPYFDESRAYGSLFGPSMLSHPAICHGRVPDGDHIYATVGTTDNGYGYTRILSRHGSGIWCLISYTSGVPGSDVDEYNRVYLEFVQSIQNRRILGTINSQQHDLLYSLRNAHVIAECMSRGHTKYFTTAQKLKEYVTGRDALIVWEQLPQNVKEYIDLMVRDGM